MKLRTLIILVATVATAGCGYTVVQPGHVGIQINLSGSDKGVQDLPLKTGRIFYNPINETVYTYPTFVQTAKWSKDPTEGSANNEELSFTTKDQMVVFADVSLSYSLISSQVPNFYVKFRSDDLNQFTHGFLRNVARDQFNETAGKYGIEQIMGDNEPFITEVRKRIQDQVSSLGVKIEQFGFIGAPRPPVAVVQAINAKIQATQIAIQIENELRAATATAAKKVAEAEGNAKAAIATANGQAEANRIKSASINPAILDWERLAATREAISKWNGAPSMINGGGGSPMNFLFQIPTQH